LDNNTLSSEEANQLSLIDSKHLRKKVVLLGDPAVGKTSLVRRFVVDVFSDKYIATIGTKVMKKDVEYKLPARTIFLTMMIWDVLGQRDYRKIRNVSLKGADGVIMVSDLTRPESISAIVEFWYPTILEIVDNVSTIVIGNKSDLPSAGNDSVDLLASISSELSSPYLICSAKTGENVENSFRSIGELILRDELEAKKIGGLDSSSSIIGAVDAIISDFCMQFDDVPKAMELVEEFFSKVGINVNDPKKEPVLEVLELMADVEKDYHGREISEVNKLRRWKILEETSYAQ